jgi:hypothetical protein
MGNKTTVLMISNKENDTVGIVSPIDENTVQITWDQDIKEILTLEEFEVFMENPEVELTEEVLEDEETVDENSAQDSIKVPASLNKGDGNPKTRYETMRSIIGSLADMDTTSLVKYFNDQQAMVGGEAGRAGVDDKSASNMASIKMKPSAAMENTDIKLDKESQDSIFGESSLSDESKEKISTLFEAAVSAKIIDEVLKLQEMYETKLKDHIEEISTELSESVDEYLNRVAATWLEDNEVAIESSLKMEMFNEFMEGLHGLMTDHYIDLPNDKVDIFEKVVKENEDLNLKINEEINKSIVLEKTINNMKKSNIILNMSEGLTLVQKEKLKKLTENTALTDEIGFKKSIDVIKEGFLKEKNNNSNVLEEGIKEEKQINQPKVSNDSRMNRMADVLSSL